MRDLFHHLLVPNHTNNFRAKLLHHKNILLATLLLFFGGLFLSIIRTNYPSVLGVSVDIQVQKLLLLTNKERQENNLSPLTLNPKLSLAAAKKAENMFEQNYWAHNSPDGKTPWVFIRDAGYNYIYAGENLARGFDTADKVVGAWMASPKHRANVLSENFREVGFAVKKGKLNNEETVLVVEEFGDQGVVGRQEVSSSTDNALSQAFSETNGYNSFIKSLSLTLSVDKIILSVFILVLILDMVVVERKRIIRFVGHNIDHIFFLVLVLLIIGVLSKGAIL
ncbi:MAG: CAP domain-containing protein [Patescibacteria group bacterium]